MFNKPFGITKAEFDEIAASEELQGGYGADDAKEMAEILKDEYIAKFDVNIKTPEYIGDLFVLQPDNLKIPAIRMHRGLNGQLVILRES